MNRISISDLTEFIQKASKLGKYNSNTGGGLLIAVRAAEKGLLPDEPKEIDYLLEHMEELFIRQKDLNLSPQSQDVYFTRIRRAIDDYKNYGQDAKAIYAWSPKLRPKKNSTKKVQGDKTDKYENDFEEQEPKRHSSEESVIKEIGGVRLNVVTWRLRPGVMVKIELPEDLNKSDVERIKRLLDLEVEIFS
jgi:hypothetical protein